MSNKTLHALVKPKRPAIMLRDIKNRRSNRPTSNAVVAQMTNETSSVPVECARISSKNYTSTEFAAKEKENLWPKVWQVACREEDIPNVGDYTVYNIADETIVVVRRPNNVFNAFFNVCPHRGRQILEGSGHAVNFRCGYHNWTFDLDGKNVIVQDKEDWGGFLDKECIDLVSVRTGTWGGFVFICMDNEAESLAEYLNPIPEYLDPYEFENMRYRWALELHLDCNWKVALEAFMEGYHVAATHTQLLPQQGDDYTQSAAHGKHSHFGYWQATVPLGQPSPRLKRAAPPDPRPGIVEFSVKWRKPSARFLRTAIMKRQSGLWMNCPPMLTR